MSHPFRKRDDGPMGSPQDGSTGSPQGGPVYLTEGGFKRLQEKLARLKRNLPDFINEAQRTAEYGDRSDNAEYKEVKSILRRTHRQIFSIQDQIKRVVIIKSGPNVSGTVQLGSTVVLEVGGERKTFQIVGPHETNPANGRISYKSPLGAALISRKRGNVVTVRSREYLILEIR